MTIVEISDYTIIKSSVPENRQADVRQCIGTLAFGMLQTSGGIKKEFVCINKQKGVNATMNVEDIPVPAMAAIRVSKEGKSALFETTIIQTTDNKYIYTMPVRVDDKLVNFEAKGLLKEIKIEFAPFEFYEWRNISIIRFVEDGKSYLRIRTTTPGIRAMAWPDKPVTSQNPKKKKQIIQDRALEAAKATQTQGEQN